MGLFKDLVKGLTGDSSSKVSRAGHDFRDDSGAREGKDKESFKSAPDWADRGEIGGVDKFPNGK